MQKNDYITILEQGLRRKIKILDLIININTNLKEFLKSDNFNLEEFEKIVSEKSKLIDELDLLDNGFTEVYNRVKDDLTNYKDNYATQINEMKILIQQITDKSVSIRVEEERTKELAAKRFVMLKQDIKKRRISNKVANEYYKKMSNLNFIDSQFLDKKK